VLAAALSFHTFFEGAAVSLTLSTPNAAAWGFALAVVLHKLPEGVVWGLALGAAFPEDLVRLPRILLVPGLCTLIGVLLGLGFAQLADAPWIHAAFGIAAGAVLYIGFGELLPGLREVGMVQPRTVCGSWLLGMLVMAALVAVAASLGGAA
jgi:zinc transporter ZupT